MYCTALTRARTRAFLLIEVLRTYCTYMRACVRACVCACTQVTDTAAHYNTDALNFLGYFHLTCNHSAHERVVPHHVDAGGHSVGTQAIEQEWNQLRRFMRQNYVDTCILTPELTQYYLDDYVFRRNSGLLGTDGAANTGTAFRAVADMLRTVGE